MRKQQPNDIGRDHAFAYDQLHRVIAVSPDAARKVVGAMKLVRMLEYERCEREIVDDAAWQQHVQQILTDSWGVFEADPAVAMAVLDSLQLVE